MVAGMKDMTEPVLRHPRAVIVVVTILTLALGYGMRFMTTDTDVTRVLPDHIPAKALYDRVGLLFPSKEAVVIGIEDNDLFAPERLVRLHRLTERLEKLSKIDSVLSPTNARVLTAVPGGIEAKPASDVLPQTLKDAEALRARLYDQPLLVDALLARDGHAVVILVFIKTGVREADAARDIVELAGDPARNEGFTLHVTGRPASAYWSRKVMGRDMGVLTSAALAVIVLLLFVTFRSLRGVLLPLAVVIGAVCWTLGLMGYLGVPFTHSIEVLPILLLAIGIADSVHILKSYTGLARGATRRDDVVRATMTDLSRPVILTSLTTIAGFLALDTSGIVSIQTLGWLTAFGIFAALVLSLTFLPAVLTLLPLPRYRRVDNASQDTGPLERIALRYGAFLNRNTRVVGIVIIVVVVASAVGATFVRVEFSTLSNYRPDHPFRLASDTVNRHFASSTSLTIIVEGGAPDALKEPALLRKMDELVGWLRAQPHVGAVQSIVDYVKQIHRALHGGNPAAYRLPTDREWETGTELARAGGREIAREVRFEVSGRDLVGQYLALYELGGRPDDLANVVTPDYATARVNVFIDTDRSSVIGSLRERVRDYIATLGLRAELTGMAELLRAVNDLVVYGQAWSIAVSLLLVFGMTALLFRSVALGVFCAIPVCFSLFTNFGIMGFFGIPLNVETMATSAIAVGVGVDYAIHYVHRYQKVVARGLDYAPAAIETLRDSGVSVFLNAAVVASGFFILLLSAFKGVQYLGLLIGLTMVTSAFAALTVLPVIFMLWRPKAFAAEVASVPPTVAQEYGR